MALNELNPSFSESPAIQSSICARCGKTAEIHLALLGDAFHPGETFCLSCGETMIHELRKQHIMFSHADHNAVRHASFADIGGVSRSLLHTDASLDEIDEGIIFWEGYGWSSDGPFAGA